MTGNSRGRTGSDSSGKNGRFAARSYSGPSLTAEAEAGVAEKCAPPGRPRRRGHKFNVLQRRAGAGVELHLEAEGASARHPVVEGASERRPVVAEAAGAAVVEAEEAAAEAAVVVAAAAAGEASKAVNAIPLN